MKILTVLFGGSVGFGRLKIKKWTIYPLSIAVIMLALVGAFEMDVHSPKFAAETLEMAHNASGNDDEVLAAELYWEACDEGSDEACVTADPVAQKRFYETECKKGDQKSCQNAQEVDPSYWIPADEKACERGDKNLCREVQKIKAMHWGPKYKNKDKDGVVLNSATPATKPIT